MFNKNNIIFYKAKLDMKSLYTFESYILSILTQSNDVFFHI